MSWTKFTDRYPDADDFTQATLEDGSTARVVQVQEESGRRWWYTQEAIDDADEPLLAWCHVEPDFVPGHETERETLLRILKRAAARPDSGMQVVHRSAWIDLSFASSGSPDDDADIELTFFFDSNDNVESVDVTEL